MYEAVFIQELLKAGKKHLAQKFCFTYRYIEDVLSLNNRKISEFIDLICQCELKIKDMPDSKTSASYLDLYLCTNNGKLVTRLYDEKDDISVSTVNFRF